MVGDVVLAPLLSTDLSGSEIRHAVVLSEVGMEDWILCGIVTTRQRGDSNRYIPIAEHDLDYGELEHRSWVRVDRIYTVNERIFRRTVGRLSAAKYAEIAAAVRNLF